MAVYVVDASVVIQYAITQTYTPEARVLVTQMYQGEQLCIPEFCLLECVNVLWKEVRFRGLPQTQAEQIVGELLALSFRIMPTVHLLPRALQIGLSYQLALYDSLYIALLNYAIHGIFSARLICLIFPKKLAIAMHNWFVKGYVLVHRI